MFLVVLASGCMAPKWAPLGHPGKDYDAEAVIVTPWGTQRIVVHSRVNPLGTSTNGLSDLLVNP